MKVSIFKTFLSVAVIGFFLVLAFGSEEDSGSSDSSSSPSSENKYCSKHDVMYNPNNAWKGCPKCVKEEDEKKMEKALEKSRRL